MKAAVYYGIGDIRPEEIEKPKISKDEILIKVKACAICGTDIRIYKFGHFKIPKGVKRILGHEISGEIVEVGSDVKDYTIGQRVVIPPNVGCGKCEMCKQGFNQLCANYEAFGISWDGGFAEYMKVPGHAIKVGNVMLIPENLSYDEAALCEPLSCCYNSYKALNTKPGDTVVIIGAGPIGVLHAMINKIAGATKIIMVDIIDSRLAEVEAMGVADLLVNSMKTDLKEVMNKETKGLGADVVITANSVPAIQQLALEIAAVHGRISFFGGMPKGKEEVTLNTNLIHYKELIVLGTTGSSLQDVVHSIYIAASDRMDLKPIVTKKFTIDECNAAFEYAASGEGLKALIVNE
ncbi:MAG: alcohol dehydrogenase [Firmicutes bacterium HGW-Firmicutes-1]|jgi:threonine dehydrogenase-like Zn-dependent dehydrogenase|nr:MAG: alcohol dehydrogenase [Firmicutes bacterium HGW-Firmicutes-1]